MKTWKDHERSDSSIGLLFLQHMFGYLLRKLWVRTTEALAGVKRKTTLESRAIRISELVQLCFLPQSRNLFSTFTVVAQKKCLFAPASKSRFRTTFATLNLNWPGTFWNGSTNGMTKRAVTPTAGGLRLGSTKRRSWSAATQKGSLVWVALPTQSGPSTVLNRPIGPFLGACFRSSSMLQFRIPGFAMFCLYQTSRPGFFDWVVFEHKLQSNLGPSICRSRHGSWRNLSQQWTKNCQPGGKWDCDKLKKILVGSGRNMSNIWEGHLTIAIKNSTTRNPFAPQRTCSSSDDSESQSKGVSWHNWRSWQQWFDLAED